jgi:hypothetical protein
VPSVGEFEEGKTYRLVLEDWYWHPELKAVPRKSVFLEDNPHPARFYSVGKKR